MISSKSKLISVLNVIESKERFCGNVFKASILKVIQERICSGLDLTIDQEYYFKTVKFEVDTFAHGYNGIFSYRKEEGIDSDILMKIFLLECWESYTNEF
ncbi:hypothetical protein [Enterovibrio paralichthyis]|uniref:hypothetical protein n=1 Tax=Enterovibrio paralichthyis TaxID=2853805 RepID=UPI001C4864CE|nr:hypothetical protein [Enterovibrio paralichthyis]MBV7300193.1 hypothetical protein [Enterovibrio paralichthyis]